MVDHKELRENLKVGTGCIIFLGLTAYVIFYLKPSFKEILDFLPYIAIYFLGYLSKSNGGKR
jgi:hypothetical protein